MKRPDDAIKELAESGNIDDESVAEYILHLEGTVALLEKQIAVLRHAIGAASAAFQQAVSVTGLLGG